MPYAGLGKLYPEVLELLTYAVFQLVIIHNMASLECILEGAKKDGSQRVVYGDYRDDEGGQFIPHCCDCLHCALTGVRWCCHAEGGHDLLSCPAEPFQFIVLTSSVFEHIALI